MPGCRLFECVDSGGNRCQNTADKVGEVEVPGKVQDRVVDLESRLSDVRRKGKVARNKGTRLDLDRLASVRVNTSAIERRAATLPGRRSIKGDWQTAWLLKAVTLIDLTTLSGDDTPGRVRRLAAKARYPIRHDILEALEMQSAAITVGAVCVYYGMIGECVSALEDANIPVAAVATGFPAGLMPLHLRRQEIRDCVEAGASEIDVVISRRHALLGDWDALYDEVRQFREDCGDARLKTILATGELGTLRNVSKAALICMMAGSDFIKTSTGKEPVNATLPVSLVMMRAIRDYFDETGVKVGFKPAGGIAKAKDALTYLALVKEELGNDWLRPKLFRFGASSLLADIERQLEHRVSGKYSAHNRHPMG